MKRIVSILAVLVLLLCSTAALAAAPSLSADLPKKVDYGTKEPVFSVKYNGSTYRWMSVWMKAVTFNMIIREFTMKIS